MKVKITMETELGQKQVIEGVGAFVAVNRPGIGTHCAHVGMLEGRNMISIIDSCEGIIPGAILARRHRDLVKCSMGENDDDLYQLKSLVARLLGEKE